MYVQLVISYHIPFLFIKKLKVVEINQNKSVSPPDLAAKEMFRATESLAGLKRCNALTD